jgi:hypothetical protein
LVVGATAPAKAFTLYREPRTLHDLHGKTVLAKKRLVAHQLVERGSWGQPDQGRGAVFPHLSPGWKNDLAS